MREFLNSPSIYIDKLIEVIIQIKVDIHLYIKKGGMLRTKNF